MIIATRVLKLRRAGGDIEIPVRLRAPHETKDQVWRCQYEIDWPDGNRKHAAQGVDSVQAIVLALSMIGAEIYASEYHKSGKLMLDAPHKGYGFPITNNLRDLLIGDDAKFF